jgi:L-lysine exporter family protein LysE/ArgO
MFLVALSGYRLCERTYFQQPAREFIMPAMTITPSASPFIHGFLLCASIIIAVGPQNLFILRQGLQRQHLLATALFSTLADVVLIALAVGGLSATIAANSLLQTVIAAAGTLFLVWCGGGALLRAYRGGTASGKIAAQTAHASLRTTIVAALCFSFLNPAAYLDTLVIIGSTSMSFSAYERLFFAIGAVMASTVWFFTLSFGASKLTQMFRYQAAWRVLDVISGCIMIGIASTLFGALIYAV